MGTVQPIQLTDAGFLKKLRAIAKDSLRVVLTKHAKQRMKKRRINQRQVMECLRKGWIYERAHLTIQGDWKATIEHQYAGSGSGGCCHREAGGRRSSRGCDGHGMTKEFGK